MLSFRGLSGQDRERERETEERDDVDEKQQQQPQHFTHNSFHFYLLFMQNIMSHVFESFMSLIIDNL